MRVKFELKKRVQPARSMEVRGDMVFGVFPRMTCLASPSHCTLEILYTQDGTFNFWALEATDFVESKFLLYFCLQDYLGTGQTFAEL